MFDGVQLFPIEVELEKTAFQYSNPGSFTQVQLSSTAILASVLRYSFPVQQSWQLYSGTAFQYNNPGSFTQVQQSWQLYSGTAILAALLRYSFPVQQYWQLYSGTAILYSNTGSFTQVQQYCTATLAALLRYSNTYTAILAALLRFIKTVQRYWQLDSGTVF
jgi:hypothetical protein